MNKNISDGEIIKLSVKLLDEEERHKIRQGATMLMKTVHSRNPRQKSMFGDMMAYELLWKVGRWLNKEDSLDG